MTPIPSNGSPTSDAAAVSIEPHAADTVRPRVSELIKRGCAIETDRTRPTRTGRKAVVLVAAKECKQ